MDNLKSYEEFLSLNEGDEINMAMSQLQVCCDTAISIQKKLDGKAELPAWIQSKITLAKNYLRAVDDYINIDKADDVTEELDEWAEAGPNAIKGVGYKDAATAKRTVEKIDKLKKKDHSHAMSIATSMETKAKTHEHKTPEMKEAAKILRAWIDKNKKS